jgi:hypothetical protein
MSSQYLQLTVHCYVQEWTRLLKRHEQHGLTHRLRAIFNGISTNTLSLLDGFRAACISSTSVIFKVCYVSALLIPLCSSVAHSAITLVSLPAFTNQELKIPHISSDSPIDVPWSADMTFGPDNAALIEIGSLGASWTYLEQVAQSSVADTMPQGYLVPLLTWTDSTSGNQYPTDVVHIQCECSWVAPTLPPATSTSSISVSLESFDIIGIQSIPMGQARTCFHISIACCVSLLYPCRCLIVVKFNVSVELYTSHFWSLCLDTVVCCFDIAGLYILTWYLV